VFNDARWTVAASALLLAPALLGCSDKEEKGAGGDGPSGGRGGNPAETIVDCVPLAGDFGGAGGESSLPSDLRWSSSDALVIPKPDERHPIVSVKDPSIVRFEDQWHVFATTANEARSWSMVYLSFADWAEASGATQHHLGDQPALNGYHAAPQVFYFEPHQKWYLIFQSGQPQYTTNDDLTNPAGWAQPVNFFPSEPQTVKDNKGMGGWLDFFVICDDAKCHLFFTDDNGTLYRSETALGDFPNGFGEPVVTMKGTKNELFEGNSHYRIAETGQYLTLVEAIGPTSRRYYRSFLADSLDGEWTELAGTWEAPFAGLNSVTFQGGTEWTRDVSHGELLRTTYDQTPTVSLSCLRFL
jgi:endo-1,4-beta-xylanase